VWDRATTNTHHTLSYNGGEMGTDITRKWKLLTGANSTARFIAKKECVVVPSVCKEKYSHITFPSFQNDIWRLDPRGNGLLKSLYLDQLSKRKQAPATMFDRHTILAIHGVQEAVVLARRGNPNAPTFFLKKTGQLREKHFWANSVSLPTKWQGPCRRRFKCQSTTRHSCQVCCRDLESHHWSMACRC
jgi:hypothetical protein